MSELDSPPPPSPVDLLPHQVNHVMHMVTKLQHNMFCSDFSPLGSGKTYTTTAIADRLGLPHVVVVCPVSVKTKWDHMRERHGLRLKSLLGYCEMRSTRNRQPKHGYLNRRDYTVSIRVGERGEVLEDVNKVEFTSTDAWKHMVHEGVLLVFDEYQNLKNVTGQFASARALVHTLEQEFSGAGRHPSQQRSRTLLLSGSPFDKHEQITGFLRLVHVMKHDDLGAFDLSCMQTKWTGLQDVLSFCERIDARETARVEPQCDLKRYAYLLYQMVIKPHTALAMPVPPCNGCEVNKYNAYYEVRNEDEVKSLEEGVGMLERACGFNKVDHSLDYHSAGGSALHSIHMVTRALYKIETSKLGTFSRIARNELESDPCVKVVIALNYTSSIDDLRQRLSEYSPLVLNGALNATKRGRVIANFQKSSSEHRVLLGNVAVCSTGIDLDDVQGGYPRFVLVSPNYNTISLFQLAQRFLRANTRSDSRVHYLFGKQFHEASVLRALTRKSRIMQDTTHLESRVMDDIIRRSQGMYYPGDYPTWTEPDQSSQSSQSNDSTNAGHALDVMKS